MIVSGDLMMYSGSIIFKLSFIWHATWVRSISRSKNIRILMNKNAKGCRLPIRVYPNHYEMCSLIIINYYTLSSVSNKSGNYYHFDIYKVLVTTSQSFVLTPDNTMPCMIWSSYESQSDPSAQNSIAVSYTHLTLPTNREV